MTTVFPSGVDNFTNPTPADKLGTPAVLHSDQHSNANDAIEAIERKVGVDGSTDPTSLDYRISHGGSSGSPAGSNTQIQYNDSGVFGADANLTWNKATEVLTIGTTGTSSIAASAQLDISTSGSANDINLKPGRRVNVVDPTSNKDAILSTSSLSADRIYTFPDNTGTLALTSDLTSYTPTSRAINTTAPLAGGGNLSADRTLSISQSSHTTDGYLSSTDWTTFSNKVSNAAPFDTGTPSDVAASPTTGTSGSVSHADHAHRGVHGIFTAPNTDAFGDIALVAGSNVTITQTSGSFTIASTGGSGTPGGSNTQIQYNDSGAFGGDANLTWNKTTHVLTLGSGSSDYLSASGTLHVSSGSPQNISLEPGGSVTITDPASTKVATIVTTSLLSNQSFTLPNNTGTLALTSDLSSYTPTSRNINTTAPLAGGGNLSADRTLSIAQSSHTVDGYLSAVDWTTFNSKVSNAVPFDTGSPSNVASAAATGSSGSMSHADHAHQGVHGIFTAPNSDAFGDVALVAGTNVTVTQSSGSFTIASANSVQTSRAINTTAPLTGGGTLAADLTLSIPQASHTANGYLSSTDWTTFNSKVGNAYPFDTGTPADIAGSGAVGSSGSVPHQDHVHRGVHGLFVAPSTNQYGDIQLVAGTNVTVTQSSGSFTIASAGSVQTTRAINTTAPLAGGGDLSADRTLSIPQSSHTVDGYLSAIDWTTFNNKVSNATPFDTGTPATVAASGAAGSSGSMSHADHAHQGVRGIYVAPSSDLFGNVEFVGSTNISITQTSGSLTFASSGSFLPQIHDINGQYHNGFPLRPDGGGTGVNNGSNALTVPQTGTAAILERANTFTAAQVIQAVASPMFKLRTAATDNIFHVDASGFMTLNGSDTGSYEFVINQSPSGSGAPTLWMQNTSGNYDGSLRVASSSATLQYRQSGGVSSKIDLNSDGTVNVTNKLGVGTSGVAQGGETLLYTGNSSGASVYGINSSVSVNGTTTNAYSHFTSGSTSASSFTLGSYYGFYSANPTKGSGSTITNAYGVYTESITSGSNNYAIYTNAGAVRFGDTTETTGTNSGAILIAGGVGITKSLNVGNTLGVGVAAAATKGANVLLTSSSGTLYGTASVVSVNNTTTEADAVAGQILTAASSFTLGNAVGFHAFDASKGAGSTITNDYGLYVDAITSGSNNYSIYTNAGAVRIGDTTDSLGSVSAGALLVAGGASITKALNVGGTLGVGIGSLASAGVGIAINSSSGTVYGINDSVTISNTTTSAIGVYGVVNTTNASFTLGNEYVLYAAGGTKGASSTVTNNYGLYVESMTSGSINYSIYTNAGAVRFGDTTESTSVSTGALLVAGGVSISKSLVVANSISTNGTKWASGTSFPGSPATNDRFFRTDLGWLCYYDGTRWLTNFEAVVSLANAAYSSTSDIIIAPVRTDFAIYVTRIVVEDMVATTSDSSNFWTINVRGLNASFGAATSIDSFDTKTNTAGTWTAHEHAPSATATPTNKQFLDVVFTKTSAPGNLTASVSVFHRFIVT